MSNFYNRSLIAVFFIALSPFFLKAQENNPMVVKVNYTCLNFEKINDKEHVIIPFIELLNQKGKDELKSLLIEYPELGTYKMHKLFPFLTTNDTVSISRTGQRISVPPFWAVFQMQVPKALSFYRLMNDLDKKTKLFDYVHPDFQVQPTSVPNDTLYYKQLSLNGALPNAHINIEEAWDIEMGERFIKVGVHDNGVDTIHPDIDVLFGGAYTGADYPESSWGGFGSHGTPIAGIIAARRNNTTGIAGIAGGDGSDSSGVNLIDIKYSFGVSSGFASYFMAGVVDAARSPGSYWDYSDDMSALSEYFNMAPGFGVNIGNHSYVIRTDLPQVQGGKAPDVGNHLTVPDCQVCREAFLFSLRSGVINVVARGNAGNVSPSSDPQFIDDAFPQLLPDNWIISVGASGYDGVTVQAGLNQSPTEVASGYYSLYGGNMDLIAPGSDSIVYTTRTDQNGDAYYSSFSGTSSAAPHVSGVVALLLSHYNKDCYSNRNLSIEDVEYILEKSATDLYSTGYDDTTGWGRLDAGAALKMIENPSKQIVHPDILISSEAIAQDTIALGYRQALTALDWGPISNPWPLERDRNYQVVRVLMENTYDISMFIDSTTEILDYWARPSVSNSCQFYEDTTWITQFFVPGNPNFIDTTLEFDVFDLTPYDTIVQIDSILMEVKTRGYYYHFINKYDVILPPDINFPVTFGPDPLIIIPLPITDYWYPINPFIDTADLLFSIYIRDTTLIGIYDFPCDSINLLYDEDFPAILDVSELNSIQILVYPNPFNNKVSVDFGSLKGEKQLILRDINGKVYCEYMTHDSTYTFGVTTFDRTV